jgi:hypothetical protein
MNDSRDLLDARLNKILLVNRLVLACLIFGATTFLGLVLFLRAHGNRPPAGFVLTPAGLVVAAGALAVAAVLPSIPLRRWRRQIAAGTWPIQKSSDPAFQAPADPLNASPEEEILGWWNLYPGVLIVRCAPIEGAAFFQCLAYLMEGSPISLAAAAGLLAILTYQWPGRERIDRWVETQREAVEMLRRNEIA